MFTGQWAVGYTHLTVQYGGIANLLKTFKSNFVRVVCNAGTSILKITLSTPRRRAHALECSLTDVLSSQRPGMSTVVKDEAYHKRREAFVSKILKLHQMNG